MAIDTKDKRASVFSLLGICSIFPVADSSLNEADRLHIAGFYRGILTAVESVPVVLAEVLLTVIPSYQANITVNETNKIDSVTILASMECNIVTLTGARP